MRASVVQLSSLLLGTCACTSPSARVGGYAVPASGETFFLFRGDQVELRDGGQRGAPVLETIELSSGEELGSPVAGSVDVYTLWAGVVYTNGLAAVRVGESAEPFWVRADWGAKPESVALANELAATVAEGFVTVYGTFPDTEQLWRWDAADWLRGQGVRRLHYAMPIDENELLLAGSNPAEAARVLRVSRARGGLQASSNEVLREMSMLHACATDGYSLYLAGVREEWTPSIPRRPGTLRQTLIVVRVDPVNREKVVLVESERHQTSTRVRQLAVGDGLLAVVLESGELLVYGMREDGEVSASPRWQSEFRGAFAVSWLSPRALVLTGSKEDVRVISVEP